jgi:hypothetical protein
MTLIIGIASIVVLFLFTLTFCIMAAAKDTLDLIREDQLREDPEPESTPSHD